MPFILQAYQSCRKHGFFSFIIPNPFCREKYAIEVRKFLLSNSRINHLLSFGDENVFDEVSRQTLVLVVQKTPPDLSNDLISIDSGKTLAGEANRTSLRYTVPQSVFYNLPGFQLRHEASSNHFSLLQKIDERSIRLGNICYVNYGAQVSSKAPGKYAKADVVSVVPLGNAKPFFEGKDLDRYVVRWRGLYLDYRPDTMYGPRSEELFASHKIIFRKISGLNDTLVVGYDALGLYCDDGLVLAVPYDSIRGGNLREEFQGFEVIEDQYALEYCLALCASKLMSFYYGFRYATGSLQGSYSHVYPQHVRSLPICRITFRDEHASRDQTYLQANTIPSSSTGIDTFLEEFESISQKRDGVVHDLLVDLARSMLSLRKEQHSLTADFWTDLEGITAPAAFRKLRDKGKQAAGLAAEPALAPFVDAASKSTRTLDDSLAWDEAAFKAFVRALAGPVDGLTKLVAVYRQYAPTYRDLTERIARTDRLIDQIVYKLYGLTDEEIAIVEGRA